LGRNPPTAGALILKAAVQIRPQTLQESAEAKINEFKGLISRYFLLGLPRPRPKTAWQRAFYYSRVIGTVAAGTCQFCNSALHRWPIEDNPKRNHFDLLDRGKVH